MRDDRLPLLHIGLFGAFILVVLLTAFVFPKWAVSKPRLILDKQIPGNNDLLYFATDAPDEFIVYSPGLYSTLGILPASERMADMVVSKDGTVVWTSTKSGYVDRFVIPAGAVTITRSETRRERVAPVLGSVALSANGRFIAVAYGSTEDYNARGVKILPADTISVEDEVADFSVSGDIQDIVANPVEDVFYIINSHSDKIRIYNADRFRLEPDIIEMGNSPGRFIVRPDGRKGYGAMNARMSVAIVDLESNETIDYIQLGFPPYAMCFNIDGSRLYVASRDSSHVDVIDSGKDEIIASFDLSSRIAGLIEFNYAEIIGISPDEKYMYVLPKRQELLIYDISMVLDQSRQDETPVMIQSQRLASEPLFMEVIRGHRVPGVEE
jgi:hypothetical protein